MKWRRQETRREKRERIQRDRERELEEEAAREKREKAEREQRWADTDAWRAAFERRLDSPEAYATFERTVREIRTRHDDSPDAIENGILLRRFFDGRLADLEPIVAYLERDPFEFGSGYTKHDVIHRLKHLPLTPDQEERLRNVVLSIVDRHNRREFRSYCLLARRVDSPELRAALRDRQQDGPTLPVRLRARWVLRSLENKDAGR